MKLERHKPKFTPIKLVIETEEELQNLYSFASEECHISNIDGMLFDLLGDLVEDKDD